MRSCLLPAALGFLLSPILGALTGGVLTRGVSTGGVSTGAALTNGSWISEARAADTTTGGGAAVVVARATKECFSTTVRATGYVAPRTTAAVMFNAPGYRIADITANPGDVVKNADKMAVAIPVTGTRVASASDNPAQAVQQNAPANQVPIQASAPGMVIRSTAKSGMLTSAKADPLFVIAVDSEMEALIDVPSVHVLELAAGQTARVTVDDGRSFGAHVRVVPLEINGLTQLGQARIAIDSPKPLEMGLFVHVAIDARSSCGIGVPRASLIHESDGVRLQVVRNDIINTRVVKLGLLNDNDAEVTDGVAEGDLVVSDAGTSLREGDKVRPVLSDLEEAR